MRKGDLSSYFGSGPAYTTKVCIIAIGYLNMKSSETSLLCDVGMLLLEKYREGVKKSLLLERYSL